MRTGRRRSAGFTLIELLAVLLIIGLVAGLTFPNFSVGAGRIVHGEAKMMASVFGLARQRAVATGQPHRVIVDLDNAGYWIEHRPEGSDPFAVAEPQALDNGGRRQVQLAAPFEEDLEFVPLAGPLGAPHALPDAVSIIEVQTLAAGELHSGWAAILFEPEGTADAAEVLLRHDQGEAWRLSMARLADEVRIARE